MKIFPSNIRRPIFISFYVVCKNTNCRTATPEIITYRIALRLFGIYLLKYSPAIIDKPQEPTIVNSRIDIELWIDIYTGSTSGPSSGGGGKWGVYFHCL